MKTKEIKPNQDFKHGKKAYKKGRKYEVSSEDAAYFESAGWVGEEMPSRSQSLEVHDGKLGQISEVTK